MVSRRFLLVLAAGLVMGCNDSPPSPTASSVADLAPSFASSGVGSGITVMAQNLYVGADVDLVIGALASPDPADDVPALLFAIETLGKTDFPARAAAIADEVARERPHALGLRRCRRSTSI